MQQQFFDINPIDKQFREGLKNYGVPPRKRVWFRIASQLDQAGVKSFGRRKMFLAAGIFSVAALIGTALLIPNSTKKITRNDVKIENVISPSVPKPIAEANQNLSAAKENIVVAPTHHQLKVLNSNINHSIKYLDKVLTALNNTEAVTEREAISIEKIPQRSFTELQLPKSKLQSLSLVEIKQIVSVTPQRLNLHPSFKVNDFSLNNFCMKGFYVGAGAAINTTRMNDKRAKSNENFHYLLNFGTAYSVKAGYNFSDKIGVEVGWNINSSEGQKYNFIPYSFARVDADQQKNKVTLNYTQVPVLAKFKFGKVSRITKCPVVINMEVGAQYGYLKSTSRTFQNVLAKDDKFKKSELSAVAGFGYDLYLSHKLFFNMGARVSYGSNIYQSPVSEYNEFAAPHNLVAGVNIGISYSLSNCR